jgi:hypothetical protein
MIVFGLQGDYSSGFQSQNSLTPHKGGLKDKKESKIGCVLPNKKAEVKSLCTSEQHNSVFYSKFFR